MNRFSIKSILATTPDGAPPKPSGLRAKCARLLPLTHTEAHVASVPLGGPDGDRMEKLLRINSNHAALAALLVLLAPLAAMSQSGSTFAALLDALAPACSAPSSHPLALTADELLAAKPDVMGLCDYAAIAAWLHTLEDRYKEGVANAIISALTHPSILQMIGITGIDWQSIQLAHQTPQ